MVNAGRATTVGAEDAGKGGVRAEPGDDGAVRADTARANKEGTTAVARN